MTTLISLLLLTAQAGPDAAPAVAPGANAERAALAAEFGAPPPEVRPHTRWWWMGNALREEDITFQLEQMHAQGIRGVEQITMGPVYERGNTPYLSDRWFELITHSIAEARRLGMKVSLNFGGPGWVIGGEWTPQEDRSQNMLPTSVVIEGPTVYMGPLPLEPEPVPGEVMPTPITPEDRLVAVVAGRQDPQTGVLAPGSLTVLTGRVHDGQLTWHVPPGQWRLMAFWLKYTGQGAAVDHFNKAAMERYCEYLGGRFKEHFGGEFGETVESMFCDSFEVSLIGNGIYWSGGLLDEFEEWQGYDLTPHLPAIWWEVGELSPRIRHDVNAFLHHAGIEAFFKPFLAWCERNGVQGRIQPYGFPTDILEGAGMTHLPEMEITAGEKDAVPWFDTRIGPREYTASGAHLYGRNVVTVEAYTYIHWEPYRATLEELKLASDVFLRAGANQFDNHGYVATPERDIAPTRGFYSGARINHENVWWPYYHALADYVARACYLLRQGERTASVALYSPLANQWTRDVRNARRWTRDFNWGGLGGLLLANGYDFNLINDDVLQRRSRFEGGVLHAGEMEFQVLILPNITHMPLASLERVAAYARSGGTVIALERTPEFATGLEDYAALDARVRALAGELFDEPQGRDSTGPRAYGAGWTYHIKRVIDRTNWLDWRSSPLDPFLKTLRRHCPPDFGIDFVRQAMRHNPGLTFARRTMPERDIFFVTNLDEQPVDMRVAFRVARGHPWLWDPYSGQVRPMREYAHRRETTEVPVQLGPYASAFYVFERESAGDWVETSGFSSVIEVTDAGVTGLAVHNGLLLAEAPGGKAARAEVEGVPAPVAITGQWHLTLESPHFQRVEKTMSVLECWTANPATKHFSGAGGYRLAFDLPADYLDEGLVWSLDLGAVGNVAEVWLNGQRVGLYWVRGQEHPVTPYLKPGRNTLEVRVTNTLINRISGLDAFPPVPEELQPYFGQGRDDSERAARNLIGFEPLPRSGLLGPVTLHAARKVTAAWR